MQYVFDISDLLTFEEWEELETRAADISSRQHCGVYFALVDDYTDYGDGGVYEVTYQLYHGSELGFGTDRMVLLFCSVWRSGTMACSSTAGTPNMPLMNSDRKN